MEIHREIVLTTLTSPLGCAALAGPRAATRAAAPRRPGRPPAPAADPVIAWNQFLLDLQATPGDQPATVHPTYELAIMHAAIYDAVVSIDHSAAPYLADVPSRAGASAAAAADAAAHDTLVALYPAQRAAIDQQYAAALGRRCPAGRRTAAGRPGRPARRRADPAQRAERRLGRPAARRSSPARSRATTSSRRRRSRRPCSRTGRTCSRSSCAAPTSSGRRRRRRSTSPKYAAALERGPGARRRDGSTRTADQTQIGLFWNPPIWAAWNRIAQTAALAHHGGLAAERARRSPRST